MGCKYRHGHALMVPYTPGSAVTAGDVVVVGNENWIAHSDIAANELGSLARPNASVVYEGNKLSTDDVAVQATLYWDAGNARITTTASTHKKLGRAVAAAGSGVATVYFVHEPVGL